MESKLYSINKNIFLETVGGMFLVHPVKPLQIAEENSQKMFPLKPLENWIKFANLFLAFPLVPDENNGESES